jgi:penicillin-insensitive murein endopeptidase
MIQHIAFQWTGCDGRKFGVGNISLADGIQHPDHKTHRSGLEVDIRLLRKDGRKMPCSYREFQYDQVATAKLIKLFNAVSYVKQILFNDASIPGVKGCPHHDDHFHVALSLRG